MNKSEIKFSDLMNRYRQEKRYCEILLYCWSEIENLVNVMMAEKFRYRDKKLEDMSFHCKTKELHDAKLLTDEENWKIGYFRNKRNNVFHDFVYTMLWSNEEKKKEELADIAIGAFNTSFTAFVRNVKPVREFEGKREYMLQFKGVTTWSLQEFNEGWRSKPHV